MRGTTFTRPLLVSYHNLNLLAESPQPTRNENTRHSNTRNTRHSKGSNRNQYPGITSYPNHVMYFSQPICNYRPSVLSRTCNYPDNMSINLLYNLNTAHSVKYLSATVLQPVFSSWKISINIHTTLLYILRGTMITSSSICHNLSLDIRMYAVSALQQQTMMLLSLIHI